MTVLSRLRSLRIPPLLLLTLAVVALRYPFYAFLSDSSHLLGVEPWANSFKSWCQWDCNHYSRMSGQYTVDDVIFFPGFAWTVMGFRALTGALSANAATILVSNIFSILALVLTGVLLAQMEFAEEWLQRWPWNLKLWLTLALMAVFPNSHFWSSGYAEPEQMTGFVLVYLLLWRKRWIEASAVAGCFALVRIQSVWFAGLFGGLIALDFLQAQNWVAKKSKRVAGLSPQQAVLCLALIFLPFALFMGWQALETGDPLLFMHKMQKGGRPNALLDLLHYHLPRWDLNYLLLIFSYWAGFVLVRREGFHWKLMGLASWTLALLPLGFGGFSWGYGRYMTCNLGIFVLLGEGLCTRPWLFLPWLGWSTFRLGVEVNGWTAGLWRG